MNRFSVELLDELDTTAIIEELAWCTGEDPVTIREMWDSLATEPSR